MSRMLWFTWRQQRTTAIGAAAAVAALPVSLVSLNSPAWPGAQWRLTWLALLAVPCLAGMFIGAPMFAAELEHSIHRLALTQSVTRLGLIVPRLVLVMAPPLAAGSLLGALGLHAYAHSGWIQKFDRSSLPMWRSVSHLESLQGWSVVEPCQRWSSRSSAMSASAAGSKVIF